MPRTSLVVISNPNDGRAGPGEVVSADDYVGATSPSTTARGRTVVNLCRSYRYMSAGYYVSLLADARQQNVIPALETLKSLDDAIAVRRALEEANVPSVAKTPRGSEPTEVIALLGHCEDRRFRNLAASLYRLWPAPALRLRLLRDDDKWAVRDIAAVEIGRLTHDQRDTLIELAATEEAPSEAKREGQVSLAILHDPRDPFSPSTEETITRMGRIAGKLGVHVRVLGPEDISRIGDYDALFIRAHTRLDSVAFRFAVRAEALGLPVIDDPKSIIRCTNKVYLRELLERAKIRTPKTMTVTTSTPFTTMRDKLGLPFVVKVPDGSFSAAVFKVKSRADWNEHGRGRFRKGQILIAQAYLPTDFDWRVCTLAGKPLFVAKYFMVRGHWQIQTNAPGGARYGRVESVPRSQAPRAVVKLGVAAAALIGDGLYGVDIKETPDGPVVIEINDNPNIELGYDDAAEGDVIYRDVISYFVRRVKESSEPLPPQKPRGRKREKDPELRALRAPIGRAAPDTPQRPYRPYEVCGLELEYVTIDRDLNVVHRTEQALAALAGHACSDLSLGAIGFSNEIFDHVIELKTLAPHRSFEKLETLLVEGVRRLDGLLARRFGARLLPTGMHPWFDPAKAALWKRANRSIYETYERLFPIYTHGWANVQASHVNLPLGTEADAVAMMNAAALVVPYLPALAASSPVVEGELVEFACGRMHHLLGHQRKIPESIGAMVPEYMESYKQYRHDVLRPMFHALDGLPDTQELRRDYFNARAAVIKFGRDSIEVRALDTQECVRRDVAVALFTRSALQAFSQQLQSGQLALPDHQLLVADLHATVRHGRAARVHAPHLGDRLDRDADGRARAGDALEIMLELATPEVKKAERGYLDDIADIIEHGNLSEKIRAVLAPYADDERAFEDHARRVYIHLADCLIDNRPWNGRI